MYLRLSVLPALILTLAGCAKQQEAPEPLSSPTFDKALIILQTQAHSGDPTVRANCIEALQVSHDPRAMEVIEQGLHDDEWDVRFAAAMAAGVRKADALRPVLNTMVERDASGSVRAGCIYALHRMGDDQHVGDLAALLQRPDLSSRANAALVLGMLGNATAIPLLQMNTENQDIRVRFEITAAMARLGDDPSQQVIVSWAISKYGEDQWNAMRVCADLPPEIGRSPLLLGLEPEPVMPATMSAADKEQVHELTVRRQLIAARSLAKLKDGSGSKVALDNLKSTTADVRTLAVLALGEMLTGWQAPGLDPMLADNDEGVRRAAAAAVVNIYARAAQPK